MFHPNSNFFAAGLFLLWIPIFGASAETPTGGLEGDVAVDLDARISVQESWYRVEVSGQAAGWMVERDIEDGDRLITESDMQISFRRGGAALRLGMSSRFIETTENEPVEMWTRQQLGAAPQEITYRFDEDAVVMNGGKRLDLPQEPWLTPFAADRLLRERTRSLIEADAPEGGVRSLEVKGLDPSLGAQVVTSRWVLEEKAATLELDGESYTASRWRHSQSFAPQIETVVYLDQDGRMLSSSTPMMGLTMQFVLTTEQAAQAIGDGPELLVQSFIYPDARLDNPRRLRRASYRVSVDGAAVELPEVGAQRRDGETVTIDLENPIKVDLPNSKSYLESSTYFDFESPEVAALHTQAIVEDGASPAERAEALRRLVGHHLEEKNLDSILATASEAAGNRSGDCTEHAVLLTALLRADGIPARAATGVIYVDFFAGKRHLFAYHMWSQAYYDGSWHDLDATLPASTPFDAAHITFDVPDLDDEGSALMHMAAVAPLIGRAAVEIIESASETGAPESAPASLD